MKNWRLLSFALVLGIGLAPTLTGAQRALPNPIIYTKSVEGVEQQGKRYVKYHFGVQNHAAYPADMFAAAPDLPPCGKNTKASRTWVDVYDQSGKRLFGFCAFTKPADLEDVWFMLEDNVIPPSWVYIELTDRKTNTKYKSNLAETSS